MSITASEVYFEVDEDASEYKKVDPQVSTNFFPDLYKSFVILEFEKNVFWC